MSNRTSTFSGRSRAARRRLLLRRRTHRTEDRARDHRWRGERGVTLVETMVASLIMAVGVMGVVSLLITTARTASVADLQSAATDLAVAELETIRSLDYDLVGIAPTADGYVSAVGDLPTVTEPLGNVIEPLDVLELDGVVYVIERSVTWAPAAGQAQAYKLVEVTVEYETPAGTRQVEIQTGLHEGLTDG